MQVEIFAATAFLSDVVGYAASSNCYGKFEPSDERVRIYYEPGYMRMFEHVSVTFKASGISRACSHQFALHRLASFCQESQLYCMIDTTKRDWYVKPPSFRAGEDNPVLGTQPDKFFLNCMIDRAVDYNLAIEAGMKPENASYLLPEAAKTAITVTMNARELFHFLDMRQDKSAQWEIRELANEVERQLSKQEPWDELLALRDGGVLFVEVMPHE